MKKSTIWILAIVMAFTFVGLLFVQIMYMENIIKMRNEQFSEIVMRSLNGVSSKLEIDEAKYFLEQDLNDADVSLFGSPTKNEFEYTIPSPDGTSGFKIQGDWETVKVEPKSEGNLEGFNDHYKNMQEALKGQYLYQKGLLNEVILNILNQSSKRPVIERADSSVVNKYLKSNPVKY